MIIRDESARRAFDQGSGQERSAAEADRRGTSADEAAGALGENAQGELFAGIEERFGDVIRDELGVEPHALTADEARYLSGFRNADALRNSLAKAASDRERRLSSKGIQERSSSVTRSYDQSAKRPSPFWASLSANSTLRLPD
jgi:hypothetical protein